MDSFQEINEIQKILSKENEKNVNFQNTKEPEIFFCFGESKF